MSVLIERGYDALVEGRFRHIEAEVLPSVCGVEEDPSLLGIDYLGDHSAAVVQNPARVAGEQVSDDVSTLQKRQELACYGGSIRDAAVANVDHETNAAFAGRQLGQPDQLYTHDRNGGPDRAYLDSLNERLVGFDHPDRFLDVYVVSVRDFGLEVESGPRNVEHADDASLRLGDDVAREPSEGVASRAARIHHRRHARVNARKVGIDGGLVDAVVNVRVQVNQARNDQLAIQVDYPGLRSGYDVGRNLGYDAVMGRHVQLGVDAL